VRYALRLVPEVRADEDPVTWAALLRGAVALVLDLGREALESRRAARTRAELAAQAAALAAASAKASSDAVTRGAHQ